MNRERQRGAVRVVQLSILAGFLVPLAWAGPATGPIAALAKFLALPSDQRPPLDEQPFAAVPLTKAEAARARDRLWNDHVASIRGSRAAEMAARELVWGDLKMPFHYEVFGAKPASGRSLYLSLHGGGGAPAAVNDQQWQNQKKLYRPEEGVYVAPRAPTNTWDLWHQAHIDPLFDRLIENLIVLEEVDPDRIYLLGYSAGGDGVYQLAPRLADWWGAAAMMAGHPNETSPLGLRNVPFALQVGARDAAYRRNEVAAEWGKKLEELQRGDPTGYIHWVKIHEGKGHWMDRDDAVAIPWLAKHRRAAFPERVVWKQDDVVRRRFYWLAIDPSQVRERAEIRAERHGQVIEIATEQADQLTIRLNDQMLDLDQPITVRTAPEKVLFHGAVTRTIGTLAKTLRERGDPHGIYSAEVTVAIPNGNPAAAAKRDE